MKTVLIFFVLGFSISCSISPSLDGTMNIGDETYFKPPSWIQGVWINESRDSDGFKFTQNDFIIHYDESVDFGVSYNERINILSTKYLNSKEEGSTDKYKITITHLTDNITVYDFISISDNEMRCDYDAIIYGERTVESYTLIKF